MTQRPVFLLIFLQNVLIFRRNYHILICGRLKEAAQSRKNRIFLKPFACAESAKYR